MELQYLSDDRGVARLRVQGKISSGEWAPGNEPMGKALGSDGFTRRVVIDCQQASFIDSSGVGWLLDCHKRFRQSGGKMVLYSIPALVADVLKVLRMETVLHLAADEAAAVKMAGGES
jgi:anti-anti-sigma factor